MYDAISYFNRIRMLNEYSAEPDRIFNLTPDFLMSEYLAMIDDQHPTGIMTA